MELSRLEDFKRVCESIPPLAKQIDEHGCKISARKLLFKAEDWILAVVCKLWDEGILELPVIMAELFENDLQRVDGITLLDSGDNNDGAGDGS